MQIETRTLGLTDAGQLDLEVARAFGAALDRFDERVRRVRVRLLPPGRTRSLVACVCGVGTGRPWSWRRKPPLATTRSTPPQTG